MGRPETGRPIFDRKRRGWTKFPVRAMIAARTPTEGKSCHACHSKHPCRLPHRTAAPGHAGRGPARSLLHLCRSRFRLRRSGREGRGHLRQPAPRTAEERRPAEVFTAQLGGNRRLHRARGAAQWGPARQRNRRLRSRNRRIHARGAAFALQKAAPLPRPAAPRPA